MFKMTTCGKCGETYLKGTGHFCGAFRTLIDQAGTFKRLLGDSGDLKHLEAMNQQLRRIGAIDASAGVVAEVQRQLAAGSHIAAGESVAELLSTHVRRVQDALGIVMKPSSEVAEMQRAFTRFGLAPTLSLANETVAAHFSSTGAVAVGDVVNSHFWAMKELSTYPDAFSDAPFRGECLRIVGEEAFRALERPVGSPAKAMRDIFERAAREVGANLSSTTVLGDGVLEEIAIPLSTVLWPDDVRDVEDALARVKAILALLASASGKALRLFDVQVLLGVLGLVLSVIQLTQDVASRQDVLESEGRVKRHVTERMEPVVNELRNLVSVGATCDDGALRRLQLQRPYVVRIRPEKRVARILTLRAGQVVDVHAEHDNWLQVTAVKLGTNETVVGWIFDPPRN